MFDKFKKILTPLLIILLLFSIVVMGAPNYGNVGPTTEFGFDIKIEDEIVAEGSSVNDHETTILFADPTADRTITVPDSDQTIGTATNIEDNSILEVDLKAVDEPADEDILTKEDTTGDFEWHSAAEIKALMSLDLVANLKVKLDATQAPTVNNDVDEGYTVGSRWFDITNDKEYVCLDNTDGAAVWIETTQSVGDGAFIDLTDTPANYTGSSLKHVRVNVGETALEFVTLAGGGDMLKATYDSDEDSDIDVAAGGTEKSSWTLYAIPYLSGTTAFGEIAIGTAGQVLKVGAGATGYEFGDESDPTVDTDAEIKAILVDEVTKTGDFTTGRIAKINNATGIIEQGTNTDTDVADAVTKKHTQNTDTDLDPTFEATFVKKADNVNVLNDITSPGTDIENAVTKKHSQNTDTALGTQTQDLDMGTHRIIGVVDPINPQEAATKAYADTKVATEVDPTVDSDAEIKAILVDEVTKTGDFTANRLPEINNSSGIIEQSDIEHKANGGYDFNANSAGFTTQTAIGDGNTTCDWRTGLKFRFVFGAQNETFTFTNPEFSCHLQIILIQDGTGSREATWPAGIYWATGTIPTLSTDANARDTVNFFFDDYDDVYYGMGIDFAIP